MLLSWAESSNNGMACRYGWQALLVVENSYILISYHNLGEKCFFAALEHIRTLMQKRIEFLFVAALISLFSCACGGTFHTFWVHVYIFKIVEILSSRADCLILRTLLNLIINFDSCPRTVTCTIVVLSSENELAMWSARRVWKPRGWKTFPEWHAFISLLPGVTRQKKFCLSNNSLSLSKISLEKLLFVPTHAPFD